MRVPRKSRADSRAVLGGGSTDRGGLSFEQTLRLEGGRVTSSATVIFPIYIFGGQKDSPVTPDWPGLTRGRNVPVGLSGGRAVVRVYRRAWVVARRETPWGAGLHR